MAKVYDALKRIEKERAQHAPTTGVVSSGHKRLPAKATSPGPGIWQRWLGGKMREPLVSRDAPAVSEGVLLERIERIAGRLDTFEERALKGIPTVQEQLHVLERRFETLEKDTAKRIGDLADQFADRTLRLNRNISVLLALIAFLLLLILIRV